MAFNSPPPPGVNYIAAIEPSLNFLLIGAISSSFLVPIAIALFFLSTPALRKRPVFILNVISIMLGLCQGALGIYNQTQAILMRTINPAATIIYVATSMGIPMFTDAILIIRVLAVYPPMTLSLARRICVYGPTCIFKLARLGNSIAFVIRWIQGVRSNASGGVFQLGQASFNTPFPKIEWVLMLVDTSYTSILFLLRLQKSSRHVSRMVSSRETLTSGCRSSYTSRLKALFWIAASNFVFPVLLNLVQIIFAFSEASFENTSYVLTVNNYVQIIGVLLATIWTAGARRYEDEEAQNGIATIPVNMNFASGRGTTSSATREPIHYPDQADTVHLYDFRGKDGSSSVYVSEP